MATVAPYGAWRSPVTAAKLTADSVRLSTVLVDGADIYWNEGRPTEGGRQVVVRCSPDGVTVDIIPEGFSARTTVHEYGGRSYAVRDGIAVFSNFTDQRLYRVSVGGSTESVDGSAAEPVAITALPEDIGAGSVRYADHEITPDGKWVLCVRERHPRAQHATAADVVNDLVAVAIDGSAVVVLAEGHDFFAAPRLSPDGTKLAWLSWDHPDMPWDATRLTVASVDPSMSTSNASVLAGAGGGVSVSQPRWSPDGILYWVSDESGWWRMSGDGAPAVPHEEGCEYSGPDWVFGQSSYAFVGAGDVVRAVGCAGIDTLEHLTGLAPGQEPRTARIPHVPFSSYGSVVAAPDGGVVCIAASPSTAPSVVRVAVDGRFDVIRESRPPSVDAAFVSEPEPVEFPTTGDRTAHALFYRPRNPEFTAPEDERPPLIVISHGGPTSATSAALNLGIQYWTTRGVAVVDVNYGGSTGYGRAYRERLRAQWGIVDVDDCVAAARWLAERGEVDGGRMVIRGGSAGGYTTLAALTFRPGVFAAGSSHYGVADAEALARDTHKFESRYLDGLIGRYPEEAEVYRQRSPINHTERLACPLILFQGLEDKVVPPEQAVMMAEALDVKGIPHAHVVFEGEQHGFRKAATVTAVAEAELYFLGRVLGFTPADELPPVRIVHEEALER